MYHDRMIKVFNRVLKSQGLVAEVVSFRSAHILGVFHQGYVGISPHATYSESTNILHSAYRLGTRPLHQAVLTDDHLCIHNNAVIWTKDSFTQPSNITA